MRFPQGEGVGVRSNPGWIGRFRGIFLISSLCAFLAKCYARCRRAFPEKRTWNGRSTLPPSWISALQLHEQRVGNTGGGLQGILLEAQVLAKKLHGKREISRISHDGTRYCTTIHAESPRQSCRFWIFNRLCAPARTNSGDKYHFHNQTGPLKFNATVDYGQSRILRGLQPSPRQPMPRGTKRRTGNDEHTD